MKQDKQRKHQWIIGKSWSKCRERRHLGMQLKLRSNFFQHLQSVGISCSVKNDTKGALLAPWMECYLWPCKTWFNIRQSWNIHYFWLEIFASCVKKLGCTLHIHTYMYDPVCNMSLHLYNLYAQTHATNIYLHIHTCNPHDPLRFLPSWVEWRENIQTRGQLGYLHVLCMYNIIDQFTACFTAFESASTASSDNLLHHSTTDASHWYLHWNLGPSMLTDSVGWSPLEEIRRMDNLASQALLWKNRPFSSSIWPRRPGIGVPMSRQLAGHFQWCCGVNLSNALAGKSSANYWAWDGPH